MGRIYVSCPWDVTNVATAPPRPGTCPRNQGLQFPLDHGDGKCNIDLHCGVVCEPRTARAVGVVEMNFEMRLYIFQASSSF